MAFSAYTAIVSRLAGLTNAPEEAAGNPHHVLKSGGSLAGFKNVYESWGEGMANTRIFKSFIKLALKGELKYPDASNHNIPVVKPKFYPSRDTPQLRATWLGHACYYVEYPSGLRVLFDPVFEDRCSPLSFMGPKRFTPKPCSLSDLPAVDAVVVSHSHYDHLSHPSVLEVQKHHPNAHFFVGLGLEKWFKDSGIKQVTEMDWWQDSDVTFKKEEGRTDDAPGEITAKISCLPCQHTSARTLWDKDTTLWCSWAVTSGGKSVWFGGDTGYRAVPYYPPTTDDFTEDPDLPRCPQFKQIGERRGPFDLGLIPIGAYAPRVAFSPMHANPFDAVEIFKDTQCRKAMGIHWGTWLLTTEEVLEPPRQLKEALKRAGVPEEGVFDTCGIGESREF